MSYLELAKRAIRKQGDAATDDYDGGRHRSTRREPAAESEQRLPSVDSAYARNAINAEMECRVTSSAATHQAADDALPFLLMPLDRFAREGVLLQVRVPWWPDTLFFVPDVRGAEVLCNEGVGRERVWTASELLALLEEPRYAREGLRVVTVARREFGGEVVEVRPRWKPRR